MADQSIGERAVRMASSRVHDKASRFIDDQELRVFKNNL
jgi:hypothetical protein